jgi:UDP-glucose 4-epimerase
MKVLITGAGGNLGRVLAPALVEKGHEPILMDYRPVETSYRFIQGDVTNREEVREAVKQAEAVVHAAALHGIHLSKYTSNDFWNLNVSGTHYVYEAAKDFGVKKVMLCSTMGVYGESVKGQDESFAVVTEDLPSLPGDVYGLSKKLCENIGEFYSRRHGIQTIAYRLGMFVPENFVRYGFRLLKGGVDDRDVAQAFVLGLENAEIAFDTFNIMAETPFGEEDFRRWRLEPGTVLEEQFPGVAAKIKAMGGNAEELLKMWGYTYWSIAKAKRLLHYNPQYNFTEFSAALLEGNEAHYPYADLPWWGM